MQRKEFLKSTALGLGGLSVLPLLNACAAKSEDSAENAEASSEMDTPLSPKIVKQNEGLVLNVLGDNQTIKLTGKDTNGQFTLIEQNNPPGVGIPPHVHENEDEVFQVLEGSVEMRIGDSATTLNAGDVIFAREAYRIHGA